MSEQPNLSQEFLIRFNRLCDAVNDSPQTLISFFKEKPEFREMAEAAKNAADSIDLANLYRKVHPQVSQPFIEQWKRYKREWAKPVEYVWLEPILSLDLLGDGDSQAPTYEEFVATSRGSLTFESPEPNYDDRFEPGRHDGAEAIAKLVGLLEDQIEDRRSNVIDEDLTFIPNTYAIGVEALRHLHDVVGIDPGSALNRWRRLPSFFVPKHVSDRHGLSEKGSLYELLNDAIRAYVAGAPAAAIAMCRACLEMVLREHYLGLPDDDRTPLNKVISLAAKRYDHLKADKIHRLRDAANLALHKPRLAGRSGAYDEKLILDFFRELNLYIEHAPEKGGST